MRLWTPLHGLYALLRDLIELIHACLWYQSHRQIQDSLAQYDRAIHEYERTYEHVIETLDQLIGEMRQEVKDHERG